MSEGSSRSSIFVATDAAWGVASSTAQVRSSQSGSRRTSVFTSATKSVSAARSATFAAPAKPVFVPSSSTRTPG